MLIFQNYGRDVSVDVIQCNANHIASIGQKGGANPSLLMRSAGFSEFFKGKQKMKNEKNTLPTDWKMNNIRSAHKLLPFEILFCAASTWAVHIEIKFTIYVNERVSNSSNTKGHQEKQISCRDSYTHLLALKLRFLSHKPNGWVLHQIYFWATTKKLDCKFYWMFDSAYLTSFKCIQVHSFNRIDWLFGLNWDVHKFGTSICNNNDKRGQVCLRHMNILIAVDLLAKIYFFSKCTDHTLAAMQHQLLQLLPHVLAR